MGICHGNQERTPPVLHQARSQLHLLPKALQRPVLHVELEANCAAEHRPVHINSSLTKAVTVSHMIVSPVTTLE